MTDIEVDTEERLGGARKAFKDKMASFIPPAGYMERNQIIVAKAEDADSCQRATEAIHQQELALLAAVCRKFEVEESALPSINHGIFVSKNVSRLMCYEEDTYYNWVRGPHDVGVGRPLFLVDFSAYYNQGFTFADLKRGGRLADVPGAQLLRTTEAAHRTWLPKVTKIPNHTSYKTDGHLGGRQDPDTPLEKLKPGGYVQVRAPSVAPQALPQEARVAAALSEAVLQAAAAGSSSPAQPTTRPPKAIPGSEAGEWAKKRTEPPPSPRYESRKTLPIIPDIAIDGLGIPNSVEYLRCPSGSVWLGDPAKPWLVAKGRNCMCNYGDHCKGKTKKAINNIFPEQAIRQWMLYELGVGSIVGM